MKFFLVKPRMLFDGTKKEKLYSIVSRLHTNKKISKQNYEHKITD